MKISLTWLREFVDVPADPAGIKAALVSVGLGVESYTSVDGDVIFEVEVTTNRPDCLSHYGTARELSAFYRQPLKPLDDIVQGMKESGTAAASELAIEIAAPDLCARYCGRVVRNVEVKPSPAWLVKRLEAVGQRPINNVADVTNYVLMELGHPLHAFDLARLRQKKIIVRRARNGEHLRTLDGVGRTLTEDNLVIADAERAGAIAGVMGGEDSEISAATRTVLIESAWFDPISIRRTSKAQGLHTEASHRFERGADIEMAPKALDRTAAMIADLAGGEVLEGMVDRFPQRRPRPELALRASEIVRILGFEVPGDEVERILRALGFEAVEQAKGHWSVRPPSWRLDIGREVDLVEEVARQYGYDRLPSRVRPAPPRPERDTRREKELTVSSVLVGLGYHEIIASAMVDPNEDARFSDRAPVRILNPISQEASAMRTTAVPSLIHAVRWNLDRGQDELRFFEVGKTYAARPEGVKGLPEERRILTLGASGHRRPASVHDGAKPLDIFDLKGDLEALLENFEIPSLSFEPASVAYYEAGLSGRFIAAAETVAVLGQLSREMAQEYKLRQPLWIGELDLDTLLALPLRLRTFRPLSKFPAVERDFSLVLPEGVSYARLAEAIRGLDLPELASIRPGDLFRGGSVATGHYSLLLRVTFQSQDHTLISEEVDRLGQRVLAALEPLGAQLRKS
jgi:phenylalanyl-tRNA synthetase beta chain